jgi:thymidylate synthase (FAD)
MPTIIEPQVSLLSITPHAETLIERAGRTCYKSEDKITPESAPKFVEMICKRQHESVLEHAVASFLLTTDRGITHEIVRHRLASYSQESTRYVNYYKKGDIRVVKPLDLNPACEAIWLTAMEAAEKGYYAMIEAGAKPEQARDVLPTCFATDIVITANFREWKHILRLRTSTAAHPKIRVIMGMVANILKTEAPSVFSGIVP